jgi:hypothetical protein
MNIPLKEEGSYTYSLTMGDILHLQLGIRSVKQALKEYEALEWSPSYASWSTYV